jgi:hypothetical protein
MQTYLYMGQYSFRRLIIDDIGASTNSNMTGWHKLTNSTIIVKKCMLPAGYPHGKTICVTGCGDPEGCEISRLPHFLDSRLTDGGEVVTASHTGRPLPPELFLLLISVRNCSTGSVSTENMKNLLNFHL